MIRGGLPSARPTVVYSIAAKLSCGDNHNKI